MPQRRRQRRWSEPVFDLGPRIRIDRGEIAVEDAADPDNPNRTVRRSKVVWAPDVMLRNGTIDQAHHDAAKRLHDAYALGVMGARERTNVYIARSGSPAGYADAQLAACRDYQLAAQAVGIVGMAPLSWCVISHGTVAGWAECKGWPVARAQGYLLAALDRLEEHFRNG